METKVGNKNKFLKCFVVVILAIVLSVVIFPMRDSIVTSINDNASTSEGKQVPSKPTTDKLPSANQNGYVYVKCVTYPNSNPLYNSQRAHSGFISLLNSVDGLSFGEVYANDGRFGEVAPIKDYPWLCDIILDTNFYLNMWNRNYESKEGKHYLANPDNKIIATLVSDGTDWYFNDEEYPITVWITHEEPKVTLTYMDRSFQYVQNKYSSGDNVQIIDCTNTHGSYEFKGWDTNPEAKEVIYEAGDEITLNKNTTLYAVWESNIPTTTYTILREYYVLEEKVATVKETPQQGNIGDIIKGSELANKNPSWLTHKINGEKKEFKYDSSTPDEIVIVEDENQNVITLKYVTYQVDEPDDNEPSKQTYTVIYKDEYGSFPNQTTGSLAEGENTPKFKEAAGLTEVLEDGTVIPVREGYRFLGWTKKINEIVSEKDANENNEIIYIAVWQKIGESNDGNIEKEPSEDTNITPEENNQDNISNPATEDKIFKYIILAIISTTLFLIITIRLISTNP